MAVPPDLCRRIILHETDFPICLLDKSLTHRPAVRALKSYENRWEPPSEEPNKSVTLPGHIATCDWLIAGTLKFDFRGVVHVVLLSLGCSKSVAFVSESTRAARNWIVRHSKDSCSRVKWFNIIPMRTNRFAIRPCRHVVHPQKGKPATAG